MLAGLQNLQPFPYRESRGCSVDHRRGTVTLYESALAGNPVSAALAGRHYRRVARLGHGICFECRRGSRQPASDEAWTRSTSTALRAFEKTYGVVTEPRMVEIVRNALSRGDSPPGACEHRDFSPWNVLIDAHSRLSVLDWESSDPHGFAGPDLIYFLSHLAFHRDGLPAPASHVRRCPPSGNRPSGMGSGDSKRSHESGLHVRLRTPDGHRAGDLSGTSTLHVGRSYAVGRPLT